MRSVSEHPDIWVPTTFTGSESRAILDEAKKVGVMVQVHAVSTKAMIAAVDAGVPLLVHLPTRTS